MGGLAKQRPKQQLIDFEFNYLNEHSLTYRAFSGTVGTSLADSQRFLSPTNQPIAQHNSGFHGKQKGIPTATESY